MKSQRLLQLEEELATTHFVVRQQFQSKLAELYSEIIGKNISFDCGYESDEEKGFQAGIRAEHNIIRSRAGLSAIGKEDLTEKE